MPRKRDVLKGRNTTIFFDLIIQMTPKQIWDQKKIINRRMDIESSGSIKNTAKIYAKVISFVKTLALKMSGIL